MDVWGRHFLNPDWQIEELQGFSPAPPCARVGFLRRSPNPIFLVGRNRESEILSELLPIRGIIDDFDQSPWHGTRAYRFVEVPENAVILNTVSSVYPSTVESLLTQRFSGESVFSYREIYLANTTYIPQPSYGISLRSLMSNSETLSWVKLQAVSSQDIETYRAVLNFRLTGMPSFLQRHILPEKNHYLHPLLLGPVENLIDFGGFDGESAVRLVRFLGQPKKVIVYEPNHSHNYLIRKRFAAIDCDLEIRNVAVASSEKRGSLSEPGLSRARFHYNPDGKVRQVALGLEHFPEGPSVWKFDIEGAELDALKSARNILKKGNVRLAVSIYHEPAHLFVIPALVREMFPTSRIGFGHYSEGWSESVLYVAPVRKER